MEVAEKPQFPGSSGISIPVAPEGTSVAGSPSLHFTPSFPPAVIPLRPHLLSKLQDCSGN